MSRTPNNVQLSTGQEYPPVEEGIYVDKMIAELEGQLRQMYPSGTNMKRQAHPKMHGCVLAEFTVPEGLDEQLRVGIFKEPKTYKAYIRFSNASTVIKHDKAKDLRGMAIKIFDVPGKKLTDRALDAQSQDFILVSHDIFISKNVQEFHGVIQALTKGNAALAKFMLTHIPILVRFIKSAGVCDNVLDSEFWSTTPYLFGEGMAVKYHAKPANGGLLGGKAVNSDPNYLKTNMVKTLSGGDVYFDFFVQMQTDPYFMPVEDPTVRWDSPFLKVATIKIPKQQFDTREQDTSGDDFSFSPWHSLTEHRPLGGLNRARRKVYETMSNFWHGNNREYTPEQ
jgi:hypothetical protein